MEGGSWEVEGGRWEVGGGKWKVGVGRCKVGGGREEEEKEEVDIASKNKNPTLDVGNRKREKHSERSERSFSLLYGPVGQMHILS